MYWYIFTDVFTNKFIDVLVLRLGPLLLLEDLVLELGRSPPHIVILALELIDRLAESERVEQVFIRHAFRFWIGRNETINDGPVLQDAYRAYRENGSMNALITSLVTSDAFLYRKVE